MTVNEARKLQEKAIDHANVDKAIKIIDSLIKENAECGENCVYVKRIQLEDVNRLKSIEQRVIRQHFCCEGFIVEQFSAESAYLMVVSW